MPEREVVYADPFLKKEICSRSIPDDAVHLCTYGVSLGIAEMDEATYFIQRDGNDELWVDGEYSRGCALILAGNKACQELLVAFIRSRVGFCWPSEFISPGIMTNKTFDEMIKSIKNELEDNIRKAEENKPEIACVADELGLYTRPDGRSADHWKATCPGTNHSLKIQATGNLFFCGYCNRSGGIDELRSFVKERANG